LTYLFLEKETSSKSSHDTESRKMLDMIRMIWIYGMMMRYTRPLFAEKLFTLPESMTKTTSGIVTPVSAMFVPQLATRAISLQRHSCLPMKSI